VKGGALIVLGEDYGEGSSIIQERSHAFAMKSQIWLLDPRPNLPTMVEMVEKAFELSEASSSPVMLELRIRACHVHGSFSAKANKAALFSKRNFLRDPDFDYGRICLPPATYAQEKHKIDVRWPAAVAFIKANKLNEIFEGERSDVGILCQGGMYNAVIRALQLLGLADAFGASRVPIYCMNVTYPLIPEEIVDFSREKRAILIVEEGQPAHIEDAVLAALRRADINGVKVHGKDMLPLAGEYTGEVVFTGVSRFLDQGEAVAPIRELKQKAAELLGAALPQRPPGFCVGCPERPVFSAMKVLEKEGGKFHLSADIGCHLFSTLPPFNLGNTVLGYGLGLASNSAVHPLFGKRTVATAASGTTASLQASPMPFSTRTTASWSS
jgi:indolepyruvate ferredoxin oxidoreductase alpha subunit